MSSVAETPAGEKATREVVLAALETACTHLGRSEEIDLGPLRALDAQRYAATVGDLNPLYFDERAARDAGHDGLLVPPLYLTSVMGWTAGPPESELRADGLAERDSFLVPLRGLRIVGAGQEVQVERPVVVGISVRLRRALAEVTVREGHTGPLLFFVVERRYLDAEGQPLVTCRETFIGRPDPA